MKALWAVLIGLSAAAALNGLDKKATDGRQAPPQVLLNPTAAPATYEADRNKDGVIDCRIYFDARGRKEREEFDYDFDGVMDDFVYYSDGVPVREEIDSDSNGKIDIWVYFADGIYIRKYERDLDGDGIVDFVKDYDKKK
jgi:hypothetical protein